MSLMKCPECGKDVSDAALACPGCGYPLKAAPAQTVIVTPQRKWSPGVAAVLSLVIPGAGQLYKGQILNGLFWLVLVVICYAVFFGLGLVMHLFCIIGAASGNPTK